MRGDHKARASAGRASGLTPDRVTSLGIGRTFRNPAFGHMSAIDNVLVGCIAPASHWWDAAVRRHDSCVRRAARPSAPVIFWTMRSEKPRHGMGEEPADGEQRRLEIARPGD